MTKTKQGTKIHITNTHNTTKTNYLLFFKVTVGIFKSVFKKLNE